MKVWSRGLLCCCCCCCRHSSTRTRWRCTWGLTLERNRTSVQSATIPIRSLVIFSHTRRHTPGNARTSARHAASPIGSVSISGSISNASTTTARQPWFTRSRSLHSSLSRPTPSTTRPSDPNWFSTKELSSDDIYVGEFSALFVEFYAHQLLPWLHPFSPLLVKAVSNVGDAVVMVTTRWKKYYIYLRTCYCALSSC